MLYINKKVKLLVAQLCRLFETPWTVVLCPWDSPGKNTEAGCHSLLQWLFQTQGSKYIRKENPRNDMYTYVCVCMCIRVCGCMYKLQTGFCL